MALPRAVAMRIAASSGVAVRRLVALWTARRVAAGILQQQVSPRVLPAAPHLSAIFSPRPC